MTASLRPPVGVRATTRAPDRERGARHRQDWFPPPALSPAPLSLASPLHAEVGQGKGPLGGNQSGFLPAFGAALRRQEGGSGLPAATAPLSQPPNPPAPGRTAAARIRAPSAARPGWLGGQGRPLAGSPRAHTAAASAVCATRTRSHLRPRRGATHTRHAGRAVFAALGSLRSAAGNAAARHSARRGPPSPARSGQGAQPRALSHAARRPHSLGRLRGSNPRHPRNP